MTYSLKIGLWKTLKNTIIVLVPAAVAAWGAFAANVPEEYKPVVTFLGGFLGYFAKNWISNRK